ncbi:MAG: NAD(P)-binding protein, partial [Acidimicrobiia bacterium]|nr:NAD(P)-binding protein [Acidimicrobiia bacterium]
MVAHPAPLVRQGHLLGGQRGGHPGTGPERPDVVSGPVTVGTVEAVAGDARVDEARVARPQCVGVEPGPGQAPGAEVRDEHVGPVHQLGEEAGAGLAAVVEGDRALAPIVELEGRVAVLEEPVERAERVPGDGLDLDDVGSPVGEDARAGRPRHPEADLDDAHSLHRATHPLPFLLGLVQPSRPRPAGPHLAQRASATDRRRASLQVGALRPTEPCEGSLSGTVPPRREQNVGKTLKVAVIGGGVSGLTAAHELSEILDGRAEVTVFEAATGGDLGPRPVESESCPELLLGGKAHSYASAQGFAAEHGFRFFPGFYANVTATLAAIPLVGDEPGRETVADRLRPLEWATFAANGVEPYTIPLPGRAARLRSPQVLADSFHWGVKLWRDIPEECRPNLVESAHFVGALFRLASSAPGRLVDHYEKQSWWDYIGGNRMSYGYQLAYALGLSRAFVATRAEQMSARTAGRILLQLLYDINPHLSRDPADSVLEGPTSDMWIRPWVAHLEKRGVHFEAALVHELLLDGDRIGGFRYRQAGAGAEVTATGFDYYVLAVPGEVAQAIFTNSPDVLAHDRSIPRDQRPSDPLARHVPHLDGVYSLHFGWMNGIMFYLHEDEVSLPRGHVLCLESPWALTVVDQLPQWAPGHRSGRLGGDTGGYGQLAPLRGLLSVNVSDWDTPGTFGIPARNLTLPEVAEEVWRQLGDHLPELARVPFEAGRVEWEVDRSLVDPDAVDAATRGPVHPVGPPESFDRPLENNSRMLINVEGSWDRRPTARTALANLVLAGDYVRTSTDFASMEAANESARRATNAILDDADVTAARAEVHELEHPDEFRWVIGPLRLLDQVCYATGLPHPLTPLVALAGAAAQLVNRLPLPRKQRHAPPENAHPILVPRKLALP